MIQTEVKAPDGFRVFRVENDERDQVKYRVQIDRTITVTTTAQADMDANYVAQTIQYAVRQLAFDVRDAIQEVL